VGEMAGRPEGVAVAAIIPFSTVYP
jgi:hypothetical protein